MLVMVVAFSRLCIANRWCRYTDPLDVEETKGDTYLPCGRLGLDAC